MKTTTIAFFNNRSDVGKTTLVYHLAWMYRELGYRVLAADLDPQADLSMMFLGEERLEELWQQQNTIFASVAPMLRLGNISEPCLEIVEDRLALLTGNIELFQIESNLTESWITGIYDVKDNQRQKLAFQFISVFQKILQEAAIAHEANIILIDLASNFGAINRAALIAADYIIIPLTLDFFATRALTHLGTTLQNWRSQWQEIQNNLDLEIHLAKMELAGYIIRQHPVRFDRPVRNYQNLLTEIPEIYQKAVLNNPEIYNISIGDDSNCLGWLKYYASLIDIAKDAQKPMFHLKPADGALGTFMQAAKSIYKDFQNLASAIAERTHCQLQE
ncbi:AAA family ATPase [Scytonema sp. UIC 10036]|uniref:ParA family protein n=1 Tax=Scytonema sp. UIC 10036 TaxID=2304196 RepID=UPI0012DA0752|nr:AAA family ATPase [Scytonema sp. UIC 10036]MUG99349.1 AAA family ATPase [Scytonema sp. UIC 10036]